uniref:Uncharacterized protein n=1 Tax=Aegilops tauschii subsp. strangulata TaxID=200361 RepID=A0A453MYK3_AEGTS
MLPGGKEKRGRFGSVAMTAPRPFHFRFHCLLFKADRDIFSTQLEGCGFGILVCRRRMRPIGRGRSVDGWIVWTDGAASTRPHQTRSCQAHPSGSHSRANGSGRCRVWFVN